MVDGNGTAAVRLLLAQVLPADPDDLTDAASYSPAASPGVLDRRVGAGVRER